MIECDIMAYNVTWMDNATNFADMAEGVNLMSGGVLGILILVVVWIFVFAYSNQKGSVVAMLNATIVSSVIGTFLWLVGMIAWPVLVTCAVLFGISMMIYYFNQ